MATLMTDYEQWWTEWACSTAGQQLLSNVARPSNTQHITRNNNNNNDDDDDDE